MMEITLLCVGDVVGSPGRRVLAQGLKALQAKQHIDCVIANSENAAGGSGLTASLYEKILDSGVHLVTLGDHIYRRREIIEVLEKSPRIVRPANYPPTAPGREYAVYQTQSGHDVAVISLLGRLFMKQPSDCPYAAADRVLHSIPDTVTTVVVDFHAEATSEKIAMGWHLDGRVGVVFGTHTHVPTADERVLPGGTAYITDVGMSGPYDSVLGRMKDRVLRSMRTAIPTRFDVATGDPRLCGVVVTIDTSTGRATSIERVCYHGQEEGESGL